MKLKKWGVELMQKVDDVGFRARMLTFTRLILLETVGDVGFRARMLKSCITAI